MVQQIVADSPRTTQTAYPEPMVERLCDDYAEVHLGRHSRTVRISPASIKAAIAELKTLVEMEVQ